MGTEKTFADAVAERLEALGTNAYALERKLGLPTDAIRSVIRKDSKRAEPTLKRARLIAKALGLELYFGEANEHRHPGPRNWISHEPAQPAGLAEAPAAWVGTPVPFGGFARAAWAEGRAPDPPAPRLPGPPADVPGAEYLQQLGEGMAPEGVRHGDVLLVARGAPPVPGGLVVGAAQGGDLQSARLIDVDDAHAVLRSWLPPDGEGPPAPVIDRRLRADLVRLDPIVMVIDGIPGAPGAATHAGLMPGIAASREPDISRDTADIAAAKSAAGRP